MRFGFDLYGKLKLSLSVTNGGFISVLCKKIYNQTKTETIALQMRQLKQMLCLKKN